MEFDPTTLASFARDAGSTGLLIVGIFGGFRGWYVWRWQHDAVIIAHEKELARVDAEREQWKQIALRGLDVAQSFTE